MQGQNNYFWHEWLNCFSPAAAEQAEQENNACSSVVGDAPIKIVDNPPSSGTTTLVTRKDKTKAE